MALSIQRLGQCLSIRNIGYCLVTIVLLIDLIIIQSPPWYIRLILGILLAASTIIPYVKRFTIPAMPVFAYLLSFYAVQFVPTEYRPQHIFVNILPTLERILYGANLSEIISNHQHPVLDIIAWFPYGIVHFSLPFIFAFILFVFGPPGSLDVFGVTFGWMNLLALLTQFSFPNAAPCKFFFFYYFFLFIFVLKVCFFISSFAVKVNSKEEKEEKGNFGWMGSHELIVTATPTPRTTTLHINTYNNNLLTQKTNDHFPIFYFRV